MLIPAFASLLATTDVTTRPKRQDCHLKEETARDLMKNKLAIEEFPRELSKILKMRILISGASARTVRAVVLVVVSGARVSARVAGKVGGYSNKSSGKSTSGINEEIIWISISMAIAIAGLITVALCYILCEKCTKRKAYRGKS